MADSKATTTSQLSQPSRPTPTTGTCQRIAKTPPPPPSSSMTPPPSSQAPQLPASGTAAKDPVRTPTPTHSHLSSPPPTVKATAHHNMALQANERQTSDMTVEELRERLEEVTMSARTAKASAAQATLQFNLLQIQYSEEVKRKDVELDMVRKEVEVLRNRTPRVHSSLITPTTPSLHPPVAFSPIEQQNDILRNRCIALELEIDDLKSRLEDAEDYHKDRERDLLEETRRLRERIRENRKHFNLIRQANGLPDASPSSISNTPRSVGTMKQTPSSAFSTTKPRGDDAVSALLLADQVLSQEANSTPSTPTPHQSRRGVYHHHRGTHSLSSLPSTPLQARSVPQSARNQAFNTPAPIRYPPDPPTAPASYYRRRESRDSTISADDLDALQEDDAFSSQGPGEVTMSQASQEAASMLRKSTSVGRGSERSSQRTVEAPRSSGLLQTKLYGQVTKPKASGGKRKPSGSPAASNASPTKRGRGEGVGLGIGGWK